MSKVYLPHADQFEQMNENLKRIAAAIGSNHDLSTWEGIQRAVRVGIAPSLMPTGTQLLVKHSVYGDMLYDVVAHDHYKSPYDANAHTMTLMCHDAIGWMQYDAPEAFYDGDTLDVGTYHFTVPSTHESLAAGTYQFTVNVKPSRDVNYTIEEELDDANNPTGVFRVRVLGTASYTLTYKLTLGNEGTNLGTLGVELNHTRRVYGGSDNYRESAIRQFLNSNAEANNVWVAQTKYDIEPNWAGSKAGFLKGLDAEFLAVVGEVIVPCATNTSYEGTDSTVTIGETYTLTDKFYLPSMQEIIGTHKSYMDDGTSQFPYYEGSTEVDRIKYISNSAVSWWTRSPYKTLTGVVGDITLEGKASNHYPQYNFGIVPVCTIV